LVIPLFLIVNGKLDFSSVWKENAKKFVLILGALQLFWNISATYHWNNYLNIFQSTLDKSPSGLVLAQDTKLMNLNSEYGLSNGYHNDWDTPLMSILFAHDRSRIKTIIAHSYDNIYHPVNPRDTTQFPNLSRYGVNYDEYFDALSRQGKIVVPDRPIPEFLQWIETQTTGVNDYFEE